jgi:hypothetical protein
MMSANDCYVDFPILPNCIVNKLNVSFGSNIVECSIRDREKAKQMIDVDAGDTPNKDVARLKVGNLDPGQNATIDVSLLEVLKIVGGAWAYSLPVWFFPDYSQHTASGLKDTLQYDFVYELKIQAGDKINYLSSPAGSQTQFVSDCEARITGSKIARRVRFFYRP